MKLRNHKGYLYTVIYYLIGLLVSYIVYLVFGWEYIHAPGFHHLTFVLFLIGGIIWSIIDLTLLIKKKTNFYKESLIVHSLIFGGLMIWIISAYFMVDISDKKNIKTNENSISLINKNDTSLITDAKSDTLFLKIKDSVYIDKMDERIFMESGNK